MNASEIKQALPIAEYIGQRVPLRPRGRNFVGLCPFHDDHHPSLLVRPDKNRWECRPCGKGGSVFDFEGHLRYNGAWTGRGEQFTSIKRQLEEVLGVTPQPGKVRATVALLAEDKGIPEAFLREQGLHDLPGGGVGIPYRDSRGREPYIKHRTALAARDGSYLPDGARPLAYGEDRWGAAREAGYGVLCEGESDAWTLWLHDFPALGIPGADNPRVLEARHLEGVPLLYVVREPDKGGDTFIRKVAEQAASLGYGGELRVLVMPEAAKDPNGLHRLHGPDFRAKLQELMEAAEPVDFSVSRLAPIDNNRENQANRAFKLTRLADLLAEPPESVSYVLQDTLPLAGLSMLGARPKTGKTTWARNLALSVARGEAMLGRATMRGPVAYLALEEKRGELQRQFVAMGAADEPVLIHTGAAPQDAVTALRSVIEEVVPVLVIIDPLQDFAKVRDMNDYSGVHAALYPIRDLARETGTHIMLLHHNNKADDLLGSTQLFGIVDTLLLMSRREEARTIRSIQRYGEDLPETLLLLDKETGIVSPAGDYRERQLDLIGKTVLEVIGDEELTEPDIRERVGGNESLTAKAIRHLHGSGQLARKGAGKRGDPYVYSVSRLDTIDTNRETEKGEMA